MRRGVLPLEFFQRDTLAVARELLGKYLVCGDKSLLITEVEAYDGPEDLASHASRGRTKRTEVMFQEGGVWYVYLCYGMYHMLNIVTGEKDYPAAVLIRGVEGFNGPGKLTKALGIDKKYNAQKADQKTGLYFEDRGTGGTIFKQMPRIGVDYAGPMWSQKPWRFVLGK